MECDARAAHGPRFSQALVLAGSRKIVENTFTSVFGQITSRTRAWFELRELLADSAGLYADYICRRVGTFPLFATTKGASVERISMYV